MPHPELHRTGEGGGCVTQTPLLFTCGRTFLCGFDTKLSGVNFIFAGEMGKMDPGPVLSGPAVILVPMLDPTQVEVELRWEIRPATNSGPPSVRCGVVVASTIQMSCLVDNVEFHGWRGWKRTKIGCSAEVFS